MPPTRHRSPRLSLLAVLLVTPIVAAGACGGRSSLRDGRRVTATTGPGGSGGSGGADVGGAGGSGGRCSSLLWDEPVYVSTEPIVANRPRLWDTELGKIALTMESGDIVASLGIMEIDAWGSWPPPNSDWFFKASLQRPIALSVGEPGRVAATSSADSTPPGQPNWSLVQLVPASNGGSFVSWAAPGGVARALARNQGGYAVVRGGSVNTVDLFSSHQTSPPIASVDLPGCPLPSVAPAAAVGNGADGFLVATTGDAPIDACTDEVPGPPTVVQVFRVSQSGVVTVGDRFEPGNVVYQVHLTEREGGAWLIYRANADPNVHIIQLDENGRRVVEYTTFGNPGYSDRVVSWDTGFAHAYVYDGSNEVASFLQLVLWDQDGPVADSLAPLNGVRVHGRPDIVVSPDGRSLAMIVGQQTTEAPALMLLRARCAAAGP